MENYFNNSENYEVLKNLDPLYVVKRIALERENELIAQNLFEMMLPLPYTSPESFEEDLSVLLLQKIIFPLLDPSTSGG